MTLVGWFGYRVWSLRDVWAKIYVLNDARESEARRIQAAFSLGRDPRVEQRQLWDLSLRRGLPELARDILAEGIGADLVAEDPQGYVTAVARSPDWPDWLRLRWPGRWPTRRRGDMRSRASDSASSAGSPTRFFASGLSTPLRFRPGPIPRLRSRSSASQGPQRLEHELADSFLAAIRTDEAHRLEILDRATLWNREHHSATARLWQGWAVREGTLVPLAR